LLVIKSRREWEGGAACMGKGEKREVSEGDRDEEKRQPT